MNDIIFSWKRFWCPRTGTLNLSDGGYLYDPESEYGYMFNKHVVSFDKISEVPCLILLGEPGIGKTEALRKIAILEDKQKSLRIDLRSYGKEERLIRDIFENPLFRACLEGEYSLHLFLDSLDECLLRIDYVAVLLAEEFKKYSSNKNFRNLYLRLACRTADWPSLLERELTELWGKNIQIMELAPLRQMDVYNAAVELGIDAEKFMNEIWEKEVVPLAIKPITLKFLLNLYTRHGNFPSTQKELYLQGCELLCEETNESRITSRNVGNLRAMDRLKVASRIAALMVFSNKYAVWRDINFGNVPDEDITIRDISGEYSLENEASLIISESEIEETLSTGLFTSRGANRFGWAHQTYAEFLAAFYITQNELSSMQVLSLIEHPLNPVRMLVPQLHEVSAWIATMNVELFRQIIKRDPQILLRSDVANVDAEDKKLLVDALFELFNAEEIRDWDFDEYFYKLNNPFLEQQIRPYILDKERCYVARRAAIRIARACKLRTFQNDLLTIVLNRHEDYQIRIQAGYALSELAEERVKIQLLPLAKSLEEDVDDQLKGIALYVLWPEYISGEDLFSLLTIPKHRNFTGQYRMFLNYEILKALQVQDLHAALAFVQKYAVNEYFDHQFDDLIYGIMNKAGGYLDDPDILRAFINVLRERLVHYDNFNYINDLIQNQNVRRTILSSLAASLDEKKFIPIELYSFIKTEDFPWMLQKLTKETNLELKQKWAALVSRSFNSSDPQQVELLYSAIQTSEILAEKCQGFFLSIPLDSDEAREQRDRHIRIKRLRDAQSPRIQPTVNERISLRLNEFEAGNLDAWWWLNWDLGIKEDNRRVEEMEPNIKALPGWKKVDAHAEERILSAAQKYLVEKKTDATKWFGTNTFHRPDMAGYRALRLIYEQDYEFLRSLTSFQWENWSPVILTQSSRGDEEKIRDKLIKLAYNNAPDRVISDLLHLIDKENEQHSNVFIIRSIKECWDARIGEAVLSKLRTQNLKPESIRSLLNELLRYQINGAEEYAKSLLLPKLLDDIDTRTQAIISFAALLQNSKGWEDTIWPLKESNPDFFSEAILSYSSRSFKRHELIQNLSEMELADLYIWLVQRFPHEEDPIHEEDEMHIVGPREEVADLRDGILRYLSNKGTLESCDQIDRIVSELPELSWLKWSLLEAKEITCRNTWSPPLPAEILSLVANKHNRLVNSEEQLLDVLIESLNRLEEKLHGITPEVIWLWNQIDIRKYRPRSENEFSDYVKQHLERDLLGRGIVINREVEIRRSAGSLPGERTDLHVNAVLSGNTVRANEIITVIIEVKGNWHQELFQAMETQLINRYLKEGKCKYGLYLIGWFEGLNWDTNDKRKSAIPSCGLNQTRDILNDQAKAMTKHGIEVRSFVINAFL